MVTPAKEVRWSNQLSRNHPANQMRLIENGSSARSWVSDTQQVSLTFLLQMPSNILQIAFESD